MSRERCQGGYIERQKDGTVVNVVVYDKCTKPAVSALKSVKLCAECCLKAIELNGQQE